MTGAAEAGAIAGLPALPGAYLLLFDLAAAEALGPVGRLGDVRLAPALYAYAGSANGPGGLRARIARHLAPDKRPHWHIDRLTRKRAPQTVFVWPEGDECALLRQLEFEPGSHIPVAGFGSSDCHSCAAHLVALARNTGASLAKHLAELNGHWFTRLPVSLQGTGKGSS